MHVRHKWRPLERAVEAITNEYRGHRIEGDVLAASFPCA